MAINRVYQPPVALLGEVARQAGQGMFEQERDKFLAQQAQFYSQQAQQDAQFGSRLQQANQQAAMDRAAQQQRYAMGLAAQQQEALMRQQARMAEQQQEYQFRQGLANQESQDRFRLEQMQQDAYGQRLQDQLAARQQAELQSQQFQYGMQQMEDVNGQINDLVKDVRERDLDPTMGVKTAQQMFQDIQAVRNQQGKMRPAQYAQALGAVLEKYGGMDWDSMTKKPKSAQEQFDDASVKYDDDTLFVQNGRGGWDQKNLNDNSDKKPNPAFLGFTNQEALTDKAHDLIKSTTRKTLNGEEPTMNLLQAYDELRRLQRVQKIDPEILALQDVLKAGQLTPELQQQYKGRIEALQDERAELFRQSSAGIGKSTVEEKKRERLGGISDATEPVKQPETRTREKVLPSGDTVDMLIPQQIPTKVVDGVKVPSMSDLTAEPFTSMSGTVKSEPITLARPASKEELKYLAGRWIRMTDPQGNIVVGQIPGNMYDLDEIAKQIWPPEDIASPASVMGLPVGGAMR